MSLQQPRRSPKNDHPVAEQKGGHPLPLVLGTAQLGLGYGIANRSGKPNLYEATKLIETAWARGIREFDTAQAYGDSERRLGRIFMDMGIDNQAKVVTKIHPSVDIRSQKAVKNAVCTSIRNLGGMKLHGLLLHKEELIDQWDRSYDDIFSAIQREGLVDKVGISVYSPAKAIAALNNDSISMVQIPSSILDQRFKRQGIFSLARNLGKTVYVRSIFLQGLLLMRPEDLPKPMAFAKNVLIAVQEMAEKHGLAKHHLALRYAIQSFPEAKIIFGADNKIHIEDNIRVFDEELSEDVIQDAETLFSNIEDRILNPSLWPKLG